MKPILIIYFTLKLCFSAFGQTSCEDIVTDFFKSYAKGGQDLKAVDDLYIHSNRIQYIRDDIGNVKDKIKVLRKNAGNYYGMEWINEIETGKFQKSFICVAKFEYYPVIFQFDFYKPHSNYLFFSLKVRDFKFDNNMIKNP